MKSPIASGSEPAAPPFGCCQRRERGLLTSLNLNLVGLRKHRTPWVQTADAVYAV